MAAKKPAAAKAPAKPRARRAKPKADEHIQAEHEIQQVIDAVAEAGTWSEAAYNRCVELATEAAKGRKREDLPAHVARFLPAE